MKFDKKVVEYVKNNIDMRRVNYISDCIWEHHSSLWAEDCDLYHEIEYKIEEYNEDNDTNFNYSDFIEDFFCKLFD